MGSRNTSFHDGALARVLLAPFKLGFALTLGLAGLLLVSWTVDWVFVAYVWPGRLDGLRALLAEENLSPAQAERLRGVRIAADIASDAVTERRRELAEKRSRLRRAETELPKAELEASLRSASNDAKAAAERWRNAMKARTEAVADAEKALAAADEALAEAVAERSAVEASVARAVQAMPLPTRVSPRPKLP